MCRYRPDVDGGTGTGSPGRRTPSLGCGMSKRNCCHGCRRDRVPSAILPNRLHFYAAIKTLPMVRVVYRFVCEIIRDVIDPVLPTHHCQKRDGRAADLADHT